ncbi:MAG: NUDIX domain-containing protein [Treponema sp.]|nr:NUDIX domain-containing protein [Treponema sp.]
MERTMNEFDFCPKCGSKKIQFVEGKRWICSDCGLDLYNNVAAAVGLIICDADGNVFFETRAKNPRKGFLALPGGFCNPDESAEEGAIRECFEETGLRVETASLKFIASFPNTYEYKNFFYKTCDIFFEAKVQLEKGKKLLDAVLADKKEVSEVSTKKISSQKDIEDLPLAFDSAKKALTAWLKNKI